MGKGISMAQLNQRKDKKAVKILQLTSILGIGCTEKTMQIFSKYLKNDEFNVIIGCVFEGGVRDDLILNERFEIIHFKGDLNRICHFVKENQVDIVHIHRSNDYILPLIEMLSSKTACKIVETNVFGKITNNSIEKKVDMRIFVSKFCAMRFLKKYNLSINEFWEKNRVIYNPLDLEVYHEIDEKKKMGFKESLSINKNHFLIGRFGRPDSYKFGEICIKMIPHLIKKTMNFTYLIVGCPPEIKNYINKNKLSEYVVILDNIIDDSELSTFINSIDILAHSSLIGESFGCTIAEAMSQGKPVIVNSTPYFDNAQIELVDHNKNGYVANNLEVYVNAVYDLMENRSKLETFKIDAIKKSRMFYAPRLTEDLRQIYYELIDLEASYTPVIDKYDLESFFEEYDKRLKLSYNRNTLRDQVHFKTNYLKKKYIGFTSISKKLLCHLK